MTQDVQPLTWQKRTNIEEHQQFFSKINEIIGNLAPTVDEAEQAIATANAASAAASAAASQAQTAASTVAGYDARLTAAEGDIDTNTADITAIEGREADYLKKTGAAQTVTSQIMVPTAATGVRDTQVANGARIQNDLDSYTPMVRTTGNQTILGEKYFSNNLFANAFIINQTQDSRVPAENKLFQIEVDSNDGYTHYIAFNNGADGSRSINIVMYISETDVAYFDLTYTAQGEKKIFTNFPKPEGW